jgi:biotin carboxyl carrier protein
MAIERTMEERSDGCYWLTRFFTAHTGKVSIKVKEGQDVEEGDLLYTITRLGLIKNRKSEVLGVVSGINKKIHNKFCGYYTHIMDVEHKLSPEEAQNLEEERNYTFVYAPQGAQYYITSTPGMPPLVSVGDIVQKGDVVVIAMVMKKRREIPYDGDRGRIAKIYFLNGQQCKKGEKLYGILPRPFKK